MALLSFLSRKSRSPYDPPRIASSEFKANPFPFYARLRAEEPVYRVPMMGNEVGWLITRYDDVAMVLKDERFVKDAANAMTPAELATRPWFRRMKLFQAMQRNMLNRDPTDHTRLRALVSKAFTPRLIEQMRNRVQTLTEELLDKVQNRGRMDLIHDYALPLPATIIAEMMGVPPEDRHKFHRWSKAIMSVTSNWSMVNALLSVMAFMRYMRKIMAKRRAQPKEDLLSALIQAEEAGDKLTEEELVSMALLLLVAGHETTANLIGNGCLTLLEHPNQLDRLRSDATLLQPAIEELLRYASPVDIAPERYAREDVCIAGVTIPRGESVFAVISSANRDDRRFADPNKLDISREPNKHLTFGLGNHFCLGASLARLEGQIALSTLLRRIPNLRLAVETAKLRWRRGLILRGVESLPLAFDVSANSN